MIGGTLYKSDKVNDANITIGTEINIGDLVMIDKDADGTADHTTVLYSGSGPLDGTDTLIQANHSGVDNTKTLSTTITSSSYKIYLREGW